MKGALLISAGFLSAALALAMNWLALIPWRRAKGQHWSERARLYHPVHIAAVSNLWVLPAVVSMAVSLLWPEESPHWAFIALVASLGTTMGTLPLDHAVFPRIALNHLLRQAAVAWLFRFLTWFVFLTAIALMPDEFNLRSLIIVAVVITLCLVWSLGGSMRVGRLLGLFVPAPTRLQGIVQNLSSQMAVPVREIWVMRSSLAQAYALPGTRTLLFSERLLDLHPDDELASIGAHELAHLTETRFDYIKRHVTWLMFLPWIFLKPAVHALGLPGLLLLCVATVLAASLYRRISHPLEERADRIAQSNELDPGTYARALERLHEDNLAPAVNARGRETHPHLYDRLIAAGITPDFPRPAPTERMAWHGVLLASAMGLLGAMWIIRLVTP
ncbi:MAG: hypothetical protein QOF48_270 [Verrucomicrobiota bacterium]|jgi:Zn-dependent protease with chaperone function